MSAKDLTGGIERRMSPRTATDFPARIIAGEKVTTGRVYDVSASGFGILTDQPHPAGAEIQIQFGGSQQISMKARVRHSHAGKMGVQFVNVASSDHTRIMETIRALLGKD